MDVVLLSGLRGVSGDLFILLNRLYLSEMEDIYYVIVCICVCTCVSQ